MFHFHIIHVLFQPVAKQKYGFDDSSTDGPSMSNNLVQVNVYFDSLSEELISSNILYTVGVFILSSRLNCFKVSESNNSDVRGFLWSS